MQGLILRQPVKDNFVYNNQQKLEVLESPVLDYKSSALRYKPGGEVLPYITYTQEPIWWAPAIRVCAAQRVRDFEAPDLEQGIHFRGVF